MWTQINHSECVLVCVCLYVCVSVCISRWPGVSILVCVYVYCTCAGVHETVYICRSLFVNILHGTHCLRVSILSVHFPDFECMFEFMCEGVCVCVHSGEAGEAAWKLIHHFPPWPAMPSEERCTVTVTLGSFWNRKMVHPPPASLPHVVTPLQPNSQLKMVQ